MARSDPQLNFRIPAELRERLEASAAQNKRSLTAELVDRLEKSLDEVPYRVAINPVVTIQGKDGSSAEITLEELAQRLAAQMVKEQAKKTRTPKQST